MNPPSDCRTDSSSSTTAITGTPDSSLMTTPPPSPDWIPSLTTWTCDAAFSSACFKLEYNPLGIIGICTLVQSASDVFPNAALPRQRTHEPCWALVTALPAL